MPTSNIPNKDDLGCNLVHLIDENHCLDVSLDIINHNVSSLGNALGEMEASAATWNNLFTLFSQSSGAWLMSSSNLQYFYKFWNSASTTVSSLSSNWTKDISIYYPEILSLDNWYGINTSSVSSQCVTDYIPNWLNVNFPAEDFLPSQKVNVFVNLYHYQPFSFDFTRTYREECRASGGVEIECVEAPLPYHRCYNLKVKPGTPPDPYDNAFNSCIKQTNKSASLFQCYGAGATDLKLDYSLFSTDTNTARIIKHKFGISGSTWTFIS